MSKFPDKCRIYQASTSELYGKVEEVPQNETPFHPYSPMVESDIEKVASEGTAAKVRTNLAEYLEKGIVK